MHSPVGRDEAKEAIFKVSARQRESRERELVRAQWIEHFRRMAANHGALAARYELRAQQLVEEVRDGR